MTEGTRRHSEHGFPRGSPGPPGLGTLTVLRPAQPQGRAPLPPGKPRAACAAGPPDDTVSRAVSDLTADEAADERADSGDAVFVDDADGLGADDGDVDLAYECLDVAS